MKLRTLLAPALVAVFALFSTAASAEPKSGAAPAAAAPKFTGNTGITGGIKGINNAVPGMQRRSDGTFTSAGARANLQHQMATGNMARGTAGQFDPVRRPDGTLTSAGARVNLAQHTSSNDMTRTSTGSFDPVRRANGTFTSAGARSTLQRETYAGTVHRDAHGHFESKADAQARMQDLEQQNPGSYAHAMGRHLDGTFTSQGDARQLRKELAAGVLVRGAHGQFRTPVQAAAEGTKPAQASTFKWQGQTYTPRGNAETDKILRQAYEHQQKTAAQAKQAN